MTDMIVCPYCDHKNYDSEYYEGHGKQTIKCSACSKLFQYDYEAVPDFTSYAPPCLNDGKHQWQLRYSDHIRGREHCKLCEEVRVVLFVSIPEWIFGEVE